MGAVESKSEVVVINGFIHSRHSCKAPVPVGLTAATYKWKDALQEIIVLFLEQSNSGTQVQQVCSQRQMLWVFIYFVQ